MSMTTTITTFLIKNAKTLSYISGPLIGIIVSSILSSFGIRNEQCRMIGLTMLMIVYWISQCIPIGVTSLIPLLLIPILGITSGEMISSAYFEDSIVTCFGSLLISDAIEYYNIHRKFANVFLTRSHKYGLNGILCGFLFCSGFLSMVLSNSATAAVMTPLARAIIGELKNSTSTSDELHEVLKAAKAIDLSIAFAATLGGMATVIGTGANLVLQGLMLETFGSTGEISYAQWLMMSLPLSIFNLFLLWFLLYMYFLNGTKGMLSKKNEIYQKVEIEMTNNNNPIAGSNEDDEIKLDDDHHHQIAGVYSKTTDKRITFAEFIVTTTFVLMVILWISRNPPGGRGWGKLFWVPQYITDGTVAIGCALVLLISPSTPPHRAFYYFFDKEEEDAGEHRWKTVLDFSCVGKHWEVLLLLGAGFAISKGFQVLLFTLMTINLMLNTIKKSGLEASIANLVIRKQKESFSLSLIGSAAVCACMLTNIMSNVAAANILLPSFICVGPRNIEPINPIIILFPITLAVSLALLFPFGTPPNAIIMANGNIDLKDLFIVGSICTVIFMSTILITSYFIIPNMVTNNINISLIDACKL